MSGEPCPKVPRPPSVQRGLVRKPMKRKTKKRDNEFSPSVRKRVEARSGGRCEISLLDICTAKATEHHHVLGRAQGGRGTFENDLHLCEQCHRWVHAHSAYSYRQGWMIRGLQVAL